MYMSIGIRPHRDQRRRKGSERTDGVVSPAYPVWHPVPLRHPSRRSFSRSLAIHPENFLPLLSMMLLKEFSLKKRKLFVYHDYCFEHLRRSRSLPLSKVGPGITLSQKPVPDIASYFPFQHK